MPDKTTRRTRVVDPGYRVPDVQPETFLCARVYIPNHTLYIAAFWGALQTLTTWLAWERGGTKAKTAAELWKAAWELSRGEWDKCAGECGVVDVRQNETTPCLLEKKVDCEEWEEFADLRLCVPKMRFLDGVLQQDTTGNGDWVDAGNPAEPYSDAQDGPYEPMWEDPPVGETGECLSAANVSAWVNVLVYTIANEWGLATEFAAILAIVMGYIGSAISGAIGAVSLLMLTIAAWEVDEWDDIRDIDTTAKTTELMACRFSSDGSISKASWQGLLDDIWDYRDTYSDDDHLRRWYMVHGVINALGPVGLSRLAAAVGIITYDCSGIDCQWEHTFDFTSDDGDWEHPDSANYAGSWSAAGWGTEDKTWSGISYRSIGLKRPFTQASITKLSATFNITKGDYHDPTYAFFWYKSETEFVKVIWSDDLPDGLNTVDYNFSTPFLTECVRIIIRSSQQNTPVFSGSALLTSITIKGVGDNPFV